MYQDLGKLERAKEYHILAIEIEKEKLGPKHVGLATTYGKFEIVYRNLGELEMAKEYHILAMEIQKEKLGPQHVRLATTYSNLGIVHRNLGELERAKEYHILAMKIEKEKPWSTTCWSRDYLRQPWYSVSELRRTGKGERISYTSDGN